MGNAQCCDDLRTEDYKSQIIVDPTLQPHQDPKPQIHYQPHKEEEIKVEKTKKQEPVQRYEQPPVETVPELPIEIPALLPAVSDRLAKEKLHKRHEGEKIQAKRFGQEIYEGHLDENGRYPSGSGRLYKEDGSLFSGEFVKGRAQGNGVLIMADGSIFKGKLHNNEAKGEGYYESNTLKYTGNFLHNKFHGFGKQIGQNYQFQGDFYEGNRSKGKFIWKQDENQYTFDGHFNFSNQFHGIGTLIQPEGIYQGEFKNGLKDGKGVYKYTNGLKYQGEYKDGRKHGYGTLFNFNGTQAFEGYFANNLPNGKGTTSNEKGQKSVANWVNGIDASLLS